MSLAIDQITVIVQPDYKIGEIATNILIKKINDKKFVKNYFYRILN